MNKIAFFLLIVFIFVGCNTNNEPIENTNTEHPDTCCLVLNNVTTTSFDTKAATTPAYTIIGVSKRGGNEPISKVYTYQYGKYSSPGKTSSKVKENCWMAATANDVMVLAGAPSVAAFIPSKLITNKKPTTEGLMTLNIQTCPENLDVNSSSNPDICVHSNIPISKFNTTTLNLKHIFALLDIEIKASQDFVDAHKDQFMSRVKFQVDGLSYSRSYDIKNFKWGNHISSSYPYGTAQLSARLLVNDFISTKSYKILMHPFELTSDLKITFTINGKEYKFTISKATLPKIESNKKYVVNVAFQ